MVERERADTYTHILFCDIYNTFNPMVLKGLIKVSYETLFCANQNLNHSLAFLVCFFFKVQLYETLLLPD